MTDAALREMVSSSGLSAEQTAQVLRVLEDYLAELERGGRLQPDELLARHPDLADQLKVYLDQLDLLHEAAVRFRVAAPPADESASAENDLGRLGDFQLLREVGRGGMGIVYEAEQISLNRRVALKVLPFAATMDARQLQRFQNEARAAACLEHAHIVPVYGVGCERGVHFYAMKFIDGRSLAELIAQQREEAAPRASSPPAAAANDTVAALVTERAPQERATSRRVAEWGIQAAEALDHAHGAGVVHRDIKPANLLLDGHGKLWVADFGLARVGTDVGLTMTGDMVGTLRYMSPEQALARRGVVDHRTDIYSLGVTLYELLTLQPPFAGQDRQELLRQIEAAELVPPRRRNPAVPAELETIVLKAAAKDPAERYATAQELADDLRRFLEHRPIQARRPTLLQHASKWAGRHQQAVVIGVGVLLLAVLLLTVSTVLIARSEAEAVAQRKQAEEQRRLAEEGKRDLWRQGYPANILAAHRAWQGGNLKEARDLLARYRPQEGLEDLRGFEWYYLHKLCNEPPGVQVTLRGHTSDVFYVAYSPDGTVLATCGRDKTARLWNAASGKPLWTLQGHRNDVNCGIFTRDGRLLVTASDDGSIRTWDVAAGTQRSILACVLALDPRGCVSPRFVEVAHVALSPDEQTLAAACWDGTVRLYDFPSGTQRRVLHAHPPQAEAVAFTADGKTLVTGGRDGTAKVWDPATGELRFTLQAGSHVVKSVAAAHNLPLVATASYNGMVTVWNLNSRQEVVSFRHHEMQRVAFSPDDRMLAACDISGNVWLREMPTGKFLDLRHDTNGERAWCVAFSPDGNTLAVATRDATIRLIPRRQDPRPWIAPVGQVVFHRDGETLVGGHGEYIRSWSTRSRGAGKDVLHLPQGQDSRILSADGQTLVTRDTRGKHDTFWVWDLRLKKPGAAFDFGPGDMPACLSSEGRLLCTASGREPIVRLWDTTTGKPLPPLSEPDLGPGYGWLSPDGRLLGTYHGPIVLRDLKSRRVLARLTIPRPGLHGAAFCWQGKKHAFACGDHSIVLDDVETGQRLATMHGHRAPIFSLAFSPDGKTLASGSWDGTVKLWHVATGRELLTLDGHRGMVNFVAFSIDGSLLVSRGDGLDSQGEAFLWDARDQEP